MRFESLKRWGSLTPSKMLRPTCLPIAIDFGVGALKILQIETGEPPKLVAAAQVMTPAEMMGDHVNRLEFQLGALPTAIRQGGFKGNRALCAIPAGQTFCKHMQFQKTPGITLDALVQGAVSGHIGCDPTALVYRHIEVPTPASISGRQEVICTAVPRSLIDRLIMGMKAAKLELVGMHAEHVAVMRTIEHITRRTDDVNLTTLFVDVGAGSTKVLIAQGTKPVFCRNVEIGGRQFDEAVMKQTSCTPSEARQRRISMDAVPVASARPSTAQRVADEKLAAMAEAMAMPGRAHSAAALKQASMEERRAGDTPPGLTTDVRAVESTGMPDGLDFKEELEILTDEVLMCLRYHDSMFPGRKIDRAVFIGGESRHRGLCQHLAKSLRLPAQIADPMARVSKTGGEPALGLDLKQPQPGWSVAVGLGLCPTDL